MFLDHIHSLLFWVLHKEKFEKPFFLELDVRMTSILEVIMIIPLPPDSTLKPGFTLKSSISPQKDVRLQLQKFYSICLEWGLGPGVFQSHPSGSHVQPGLRTTPPKWRAVLSDS